MSQALPPEMPPTGPSPAEMVKVPSTLLMVVGGIYLALSLLSLLLNVLGAGVGAGMAVDEQAAIANAVGAASGVVGAIFGLVLGAVIFLGGLKMQKLESYGLAMAGSIAAMLPCTCCCIIGLPIGIWSLTVLMKPEVKSAFQG